MSVFPIRDPVPGEQILAVEPADGQLVERGFRRVLPFVGRSLSADALAGEQDQRSARLATLGRALTPGVVGGLAALIDGDRLLVEPGLGLSSGGEDVHLLRRLSTPVPELAILGEDGAALQDEEGELVTCADVAAEQRVFFVILQPVQGLEIFDDEGDDPCPKDATQEAFEDQRLQDGARMALLPWPVDLPTPIPQPAQPDRWRHALAWSIFNHEASLAPGQSPRWREPGVALGVLAVDALAQPLFLDRSSAVRLGGRPWPRRLLAAATSEIGLASPGHPFLWRARLEQLSEHVIDLLGGDGANGADFIASSVLRRLPPAGILPVGLLDLENLSSQFFPGNFTVRGVPLPESELEAALRPAAGLAPIELTRAETVELLVVVPDALYEPRLLVQDALDPFFEEKIKGFLDRRLAERIRRSDLRSKVSALQDALDGQVPEFTDPGAQEDEEPLPIGAIPDPPEEAYGTEVTGDGLPGVVDVGELREFLIGQTINQGDETARIFENELEILDAEGLEGLEKSLRLKIDRADGHVDLRFLNVQTDIYRLRQFMLGNEAGTRLATSPVLAAVAQGESAAATRDDLQDLADRLRIQPGFAPGGPLGGPEPFSLAREEPDPAAPEEAAEALGEDEGHGVAEALAAEGAEKHRTEPRRLAAAIDIERLARKVRGGPSRRRGGSGRSGSGQGAFFLRGDEENDESAVLAEALRGRGRGADSVLDRRVADVVDGGRFGGGLGLGSGTGLGGGIGLGRGGDTQVVDIGGGRQVIDFGGGDRILVGDDGRIIHIDDRDSTDLSVDDLLDRPVGRQVVSASLDRNLIGLTPSFGDSSATVGDVIGQAPLPGDTFIPRTSTVAERLLSPPALEARDFSFANRYQSTFAFQDLELEIRDLEATGPILGDGQVPARVTLGDLGVGSDRFADQIGEFWTSQTGGNNDEGAFFGEAVFALENTVSLLRQLEGRVEIYRDALKRTRAAMAKISVHRTAAGDRLATIDADLAEARHDVSVARSLLAEEEARLAALHEGRRAVLREQITLLAFRRPRTVETTVEAPGREMLGLPTVSPVAACLQEPVDIPPELRAILDLFRQAPVRYLPRLPRLLDHFDRVPVLQQLLIGARERTRREAESQPWRADLERLAGGGRFEAAMAGVVELRRRQVEQVRRPLLNLRDIDLERRSWSTLRVEAETWLSLGDLLDGAHGRGRVARDAARELEQIGQLAACLYAAFGRTTTQLRLIWAERYSQFDQPTELDDLSRLPRWQEVEPLLRVELQQLVDALMQRVDRRRAEARDLGLDLVRAALLLASHAPVDRLVVGEVIEEAPVLPDVRVPIRVDVPRVRIGMPVIFRNETVTLGRAVVEELDPYEGIAGVRVLESYRPQEILTRGARVEFSESRYVARTPTLGGR